jgi:phosphoribosylglycinamide formyltransferase-1
MSKPNIALFASHNGSNVQAILDACQAGILEAQVCAVISNNSGSYALERARLHDVPAFHLSSKAYPDEQDLDEAILRTLSEHDADWIVLAGYMKKLGPKTLERYSNKVVNTHPSLLPKFGGHGMFGMFVHEAVLAAGEKVTGITVHLVNEEYDEGPIIAQSEVPVLAGDTAETLSARVQEREREFYVETINKLCRGSYQNK